MKYLLNIYFPNTVLSGHEMAFIQILNKLDLDRFEIKIYLNDHNKHLFKNLNNSTQSIFKFINEIIFLTKKNRNIVLISGSPFSYPLLKIVLKLLFFDIIEYTPFSEKFIKKDRLHQYLLPYINKFCVKNRILIDDWQIEGSVVKNNYIVKNLI